MKTELMSKYIGINSNAILCDNKVETLILVYNKNSENTLYKYFKLNDTGKNIILDIDGTLMMEDFVHKFVERNKIDYETNVEWILLFIEKLYECNIIVFHEESTYYQISTKGIRDNIMPIKVTIEITEKCNLMCKHCYLEASPQKEDYINYQQFIYISEKLLMNDVVYIELTGGEIFMNPDACDILEYALNKYAKVGVLTNGVILPERAIRILKSKADKVIVNISIDSIHSKVHDNFRGMDGAWVKTCENVKKLTKEGIKVRVASSIWNENRWEVDQLAELTKSLGANIFGFSFIEKFGRGKKIEDNETYDTVESVIEYNEYIKNTMDRYRGLIPTVDLDMRSKVENNCGAGTISFLIGANGDIRTCALSRKTKEIGNIFQTDLQEIYNKQIIRDIAMIKSPSIQNGCDSKCKNIYYCKGCYVKGFESNLNKDDLCSWIKKNKMEHVYSIWSE